MIVIGHRGAAGHFPENTLRSIEIALNHGVDAVEIDVRMLDDAIIVLHDETVDRTTSGNGHYKSLSLDALRGLEQVRGFTFTQVEGHGARADRDATLSARDKVVGYTPRMRVDILLEDADVDIVLGALRSALSDFNDVGVFWVTDVEKSGRL